MSSEVADKIMRCKTLCVKTKLLALFILNNQNEPVYTLSVPTMAYIEYEKDFLNECEIIGLPRNSIKIFLSTLENSGAISITENRNGIKKIYTIKLNHANFLTGKII